MNGLLQRMNRTPTFIDLTDDSLGEKSRADHDEIVYRLPDSLPLRILPRFGLKNKSIVCSIDCRVHFSAASAVRATQPRIADFWLIRVCCECRREWYKRERWFCIESFVVHFRKSFYERVGVGFREHFILGWAWRWRANWVLVSFTN